MLMHCDVTVYVTLRPCSSTI